MDNRFSLFFVPVETNILSSRDKISAKEPVMTIRSKGMQSTEMIVVMMGAQEPEHDVGLLMSSCPQPRQFQRIWKPRSSQDEKY